MSDFKIMIYGANGYMGKLLVKTIPQQLHGQITLAGRSDFETHLNKKIFSLDQNSAQHLQGVNLLINLAGPFKNTSQKLVEACLQTGTHYIDIAGETPELELVHQFDNKAKKAGIMLMPGAGFGVVPTDLVANLAKSKLPSATHLKIAYITNGGASRGTLKTVLADINKPGVILENGKYQVAMPASKSFTLNDGKKDNELVYNPWRADLFSAKISTQINNIETYANFPGFIVSMMKGKLLWLRDFMLKRILGFLPEGPSEKDLEKGSTYCHAQVTNNQGQVATATITGPEAYVFTAHTLIAITQKIMQGKFESGYQTPNIYGVELLTGMPKVKID